MPAHAVSRAVFASLLLPVQRAAASSKRGLQPANAAFWLTPRVTLASMAEAGLRAELDRQETKNGGPFKARERELVGGGPIGT